jgi:hypothetical protein
MMERTGNDVHENKQDHDKKFQNKLIMPMFLSTHPEWLAGVIN